MVRRVRRAPLAFWGGAARHPPPKGARGAARVFQRHRIIAVSVHRCSAVLRRSVNSRTMPKTGNLFPTTIRNVRAVDRHLRPDRAERAFFCEPRQAAPRSQPCFQVEICDRAKPYAPSRGTRPRAPDTLPASSGCIPLMAEVSKHRAKRFVPKKVPAARGVEGRRQGLFGCTGECAYTMHSPYSLFQFGTKKFSTRRPLH
jgi:hypothetical protein